jgi:20S proteasome subunit alpha 7
MSLLDFSQIYTTTGTISQVQYAQKAADSGDTCIGLKSKHGVVLLAEKPVVSPLYVHGSGNRIEKLSASIHMAASGMLSDAVYVCENIKSLVMDYKKKFEEDPGHQIVKMYARESVHPFTRFMNTRVIGANFLTAVHKEGDYRLLHTDCTGRTVCYKANSIGKGSRRAKTELEKVYADGMTIEEMIDNGVRILYKTFDPAKDKDFDIEIGVMSSETNGTMHKLSHEEVRMYTDKYSHLSVDEED